MWAEAAAGSSLHSTGQPGQVTTTQNWNKPSCLRHCEGNQLSTAAPNTLLVPTRSLQDGRWQWLLLVDNLTMLGVCPRSGVTLPSILLHPTHLYPSQHAFKEDSKGQHPGSSPRSQERLGARFMCSQLVTIIRNGTFSRLSAEPV